MRDAGNVKEIWRSVHSSIVRTAIVKARGAGENSRTMANKDVVLVILAAGKGTRLKSSLAKVLHPAGGRSLVELRLVSGRKHQIRVQLANLGCPVLGDRRYGKRSYAVDRLALHACQLRLAHPLTGQPLRLRSPGSEQRRHDQDAIFFSST